MFQELKLPTIPKQKDQIDEILELVHINNHCYMMQLKFYKFDLSLIELSMSSTHQIKPVDKI